MSDYTADDFTPETPAGYYLITYGGEPRPDGPFSDLGYLIDACGLVDEYGETQYPSDGYIVYWDGKVLGSVPALFA